MTSKILAGIRGERWTGGEAGEEDGKRSETGGKAGGETGDEDGTGRGTEDVIVLVVVVALGGGWTRGSIKDNREEDLEGEKEED